jgi:hypothetical protein
MISTEERLTLVTAVSEVSQNLREHLNGPAASTPSSWWARVTTWVRQTGADQRNPVRIKNLEKMLSHLHVLQHFLADPCHELSDASRQTLSDLLKQLAKPESLSFNNAWELADLLEAELLHIGDADYIRSVWLTWPRSRVPDRIREQVASKDLDLSDETPGQVLETLVRPWLLEDQRDLVQEYRRDRAMIALRRSYLNIMGLTLLILDLLFCWLFVTVGKAADPASVSWSMLLLVMAAGAIGSTVARVTRLSQQPLPSEPGGGKGQELPLGIRSLMSIRSIFWAQVMLGATAALVIYLVFSSRLLGVEGLETQTPATLAVLCFMAGFSEPFLTDVVGRISQRVA